MQQVLILNKQVGETPLECMDRFRGANPEYANVKMTYAGRLDPMADGVLMVLAGDAVHRKDEFSGLDKEYVCTAILGVATDSYDVLGVGSATEFAKQIPSDEIIKNTLQSFVKTFEQYYPPYSSKTINGIQMHTLARAGELENVEIPKLNVTVFSVSDISIATVSLRETVADIINRIGKVRGDFRQSETIEFWKKLYGNELQTVTFKITVSSGTYIRGIVDELGKQLGCGACVWKLTRTRVGDYRLSTVDTDPLLVS